MAQPRGAAQQVSPLFSIDVSLLLSATARPLVQDLLDANKLVRDVRRSDDSDSDDIPELLRLNFDRRLS